MAFNPQTQSRRTRVYRCGGDFSPQWARQCVDATIAVSPKDITMPPIVFDSKKAPPWTQVFFELAIRALLRVHHDYLAWDIEQRPNVQPDFQAINNGSGILFADEPAVCAAISQEFIASRYSSGVWFTEGGTRNYRLTRESQYKGGGGRADFRCVRVNEKGDQIGRESLIEAKRAVLISTKLDSEGPSSPPRNQTDKIRIDIAKLRNHAKPCPRGLILVWHITEEGTKTALEPMAFVDGLADNDIVVWQMKCVPIVSAQLGKIGQPLDDLKIRRWLWAFLAEVMPIMDGEMRPPTN
jgi:hypothetical protein